MNTVTLSTKTLTGRRSHANSRQALGISVSPWFPSHLPWTFLQSFIKHSLESHGMPGPNAGPRHSQAPLKVICGFPITAIRKSPLGNQYSQRGLLDFSDPAPRSRQNWRYGGDLGIRTPSREPFTVTPQRLPRREHTANEGSETDHQSAVRKVSWTVEGSASRAKRRKPGLHGSPRSPSSKSFLANKGQSLFFQQMILLS